MLPNKLQIIKMSAFNECNSLKSVTIPATVEFIYQEAFANCNALESVKALPDKPPFLYDNSFSNFSIPLRVLAREVVTIQALAKQGKSIFRIKFFIYPSLVVIRFTVKKQ